MITFCVHRGTKTNFLNWNKKYFGPAKKKKLYNGKKKLKQIHVVFDNVFSIYKFFV